MMTAHPENESNICTSTPPSILNNLIRFIVLFFLAPLSYSGAEPSFYRQIKQLRGIFLRIHGARTKICLILFIFIFWPCCTACRILVP